MNKPISTCCGAPPIGETHSVPPDLVGICSDCRDHCCFEDEEADDPEAASDEPNHSLVPTQPTVWRTDQPQPDGFSLPVPRRPCDWVEDYSHENGQYQNPCIRCNVMFYGHKRRVICRQCAEPHPVPKCELQP